MSILFESKDSYKPTFPRLDVSSMRCASIVHDEVHSSQSFQDLDALLSKGSIRKKNTGRYQSIVDDRMKIRRTSDMVYMIEEPAVKNHIVLQ